MTPEFRSSFELGCMEHGDVSSGVDIGFPRTAAPNANTAMDQLFERFPDHEPTLLSESEDHWLFRLSWASDPHIFVDPGVQATAESLFGLSTAEIGGYRELHRWGRCDVVISMVHSWALLAPTRAIARRGINPISCIVHVDDHTDLMAALLEPVSRPGSLRDPVFDENVDLGNPDSAVAAVRRGVISKGNFLTAYLLAYPGCRTLHIGYNLADQDFRLSRQVEFVELGGKLFERYGFMLAPCSTRGPWTFRQTNSLPPELPIGEQEGVWLDVALDYFCNRYNGDSDRSSEIAPSDERDGLLQRVDNFLVELGNARWLPKVEAVSIAVSPGFFPAEYWTEIVATVRDGIRDKLDS